MLNKIFIMGASTGIGKALAIHYSNKNIILGLAARRLDLLEKVALECQNNNATVHIFKVDVRKKKTCIYAANKFIELADGIDLVIANSGIAGKDNLFSGDSKYVNKILEGFALSNRVKCLVTGDMLQETKPNPEGLLLAANILNVNLNDTIYVGDDERDIIAGRDAGMTTVAADFGFISADINIRSWNSDLIIYNALELKDYI